jgi:hypothetical protein
MYRFDKGEEMHRKQVRLLREESLTSQISKSQLLKRKWSEDTIRNVRAHGLRKSENMHGVPCESARRKFCNFFAKAAKVAAFWEV